MITGLPLHKMSLRPKASAQVQPTFGYLALSALKALNPGGYENKFDLHMATNTMFNADTASVYRILQMANLVAEGDLHGNTRKLLSLLFLADLVEGVDENQAKLLFQMTRDLEQFSVADPLCLSVAPEELRALNGMLADFQKALQGLRWKDDRRTLLLLGDVINDRGVDDRFTLALLNHLRKGKPDRIITLAGNHDLNKFSNLRNYQIWPQQTRSSAPGYAESKSLMEKSYQDYLLSSQLFYYLPGQNILCAHAEITKPQIESLFTLLNQKQILPDTMNTPEKVTATTMPRFVEILNQFYREALFDHFQHPDQPDSAFKLINRLVWGRGELMRAEDFPFAHIPGLQLMHGHDNSSKSCPYSREVAATYPTNTPAGHSLINLNNEHGMTLPLHQDKRPLFALI